MHRGLKALVWLPGLVLLSGCDVLSSNSNSEPITPDLESPAANEPIISINDPLFSHQWYLANSGDYELTRDPVETVASEDISALAPGASNQTSDPSSYAQGYTGQGVVVSVIDTGLEIEHADLEPNVQNNGSYNFGYPYNGRGQFDPTMVFGDDHGTSVAGLVGARGGNGMGIWGVAPGVQLKGFNLIEYQDTLNEELFAMGKQTDSEPIPNQNIDIFNMSYGSNPDVVDIGVYENQVLAQIEYGAKNYRDGKGAIYVKAAGNEYDGGNVFSSAWCAAAIENNVTCYNVNMEPMNTSPFLITVGAFNANGQRASYSNTGSALWISAPGGEYGVAYRDVNDTIINAQPAILTTDRSGCSVGYATSSAFLEFDAGEFQDGSETLNENCDYTATFNGTSSATPIVSGVAALLLQANPNLTAREVKDILATTARQIQPGLAGNSLTLNDGTVTLEQGWVTNAAGIAFSNAFGFGAVDVQAAITKALEWKNAATQLAEQQLISLNKVSYSSDNAIPNASAIGLTKTQTVNQDLVVESVLVELTIEALDSDPIDASDYLIHLVSPSGTVSVIQTPFNAFCPQFGVRSMRLVSHAFYGEKLSLVDSKNWKLHIWDVSESTNRKVENDICLSKADVEGHGKLIDWKLTFYGRSE